MALGFTIPETRVTRAVGVHVGTRWSDGVWTPHLIVMFIERGWIEIAVCLSLYKKMERRGRKARAMFIRNPYVRGAQ